MVQVDPIIPASTAIGTKRLKLRNYQLLSNVAFNFNLRRYSMASIQPLRTSAAFDHLSPLEVSPGDLVQCLDSADYPCVLGKGGFGVVVKVGRCSLTASDPVWNRLWFQRLTVIS